MSRSRRRHEWSRAQEDKAALRRADIDYAAYVIVTLRRCRYATTMKYTIKWNNVTRAYCYADTMLLLILFAAADDTLAMRQRQILLRAL